MKLTDLFRWLVPLHFFVLHFGGSKSSASSATNNTSSTEIVDRRTVADGQSMVQGDGASYLSLDSSNRSFTDNSNRSITYTDPGALQLGRDLGESSIVNMTKLATQAQVTAGDLATKALTSIGAAYKDSGQMTATALSELKGAFVSANADAQGVASGNKTLAIAGLVVVGLVAAAMWKRKGGNA